MGKPKSKELVVADEGESEGSDGGLIDLFKNHFNKLKQVDAQIRKSSKDAAAATAAAHRAYEKSAGFGKKKEAIEELQSAVKEIAAATEALSLSQKAIFENQEQLARIATQLFRLGIESIANTRLVVRELQLRLNGASKEELTDLAKRELFTVLLQLKEKEDAKRKIENMKKELGDIKKAQVQKDDDYSKQLEGLKKTNRSLQKTLGSQEALLKEYSKELLEIKRLLPKKRRIITTGDATMENAGRMEGFVGWLKRKLGSKANIA